ncbi:MAG: right-handed parallel beta-helix repeat-containing protein [Candidatus Heimdallarchaeaceae archaeon]
MIKRTLSHSRKLRSIPLVLLFFSILLMSPIIFSSSKNSYIEQFQIESINELLITSDSVLESLGLDGNGSVNNPYLIQNLVFSGTPSTDSIIYIYNTTKFIEILNCTFYEWDTCNEWDMGIKIKEVESNSIKIVNCSFEYNSYSMIGIYLEKTYSLIVENNTFSKCYYAYRDYLSQSNEFRSNRVSKCYTGVSNSASDHCKILNNYFEYCDKGITGSGAHEILIESNYFSFSSSLYSHTDDHSIYLRKTENATIQSNFISSSGHNGINIENSPNIFIKNNVITNTENGIYIEDTEIIYDYQSKYPLIFQNNITKSTDTGIKLNSIEGAGIHYNIITSNRYNAIDCNSVTKSWITNNDCIFNGINGIFAKTSKEISIEANDISFNDGNGISMMDAQNISIQFNYFYHNEFFAVKLDYECYWNDVHHNEFVSNNQLGVSQAYDDGFENLWFDPTTLEGNFWNDLESGDYYEIDGTSNSVDIYPLSDKIDEEYTVIVNFLFVPSILISLLFLLILGIPRRSKRRS